MAKKPKIKSFYKDLNLVYKPLGIDDWVILNSGRVTPNPLKSETYISTICIVPTKWQKDNSFWKNLNEEEREKYILYKKIESDKLCSLIPGIRLNSKNEPLGIDYDDELKIPINSKIRGLNAIRLKDINEGKLIENTPFYYKYSNLPCFKFEIEKDGKQITCILPTAELARFYFFTGSKITREIMHRTYTDKVKIPGSINKSELTEHKIAVVEMEQGFSESEVITLAKLACSKKMQNSANYIFNTILVEKVAEKLAEKQDVKQNKLSFPKTNFFQDEDFLMGATGFYFDSEATCFYIYQIHQTDEKSPFDALICKPIVDRGRKKGRGDDNELETTKKKKKVKIKTPGTEPRLVDSKPFSGSTSTIVQNEITTLPFFEQEKIPIINFENEQLKKYQTQNIIIGQVSNNITTNQYGTELSDAIRATIENESAQDEKLDKDAILVSVQELAKNLKKEELIVSFYNPTLVDNRFQRIEFIITPNFYKHRFVIMQITFGLSNFYLFDFYYGAENVNRARLIYSPNKGPINNVMMDTITNTLQEKYYDWDKTYDVIKHLFEEKRFNHNLSKEQFLSGDRIAAFIKNPK